MFVFEMTTESPSDNKVSSLPIYRSSFKRNTSDTKPARAKAGKYSRSARSSRGNKKRSAREKTKSHSDGSH